MEKFTEFINWKKYFKAIGTITFGIIIILYFSGGFNILWFLTLIGPVLGLIILLILYFEYKSFCLKNMNIKDVRKLKINKLNKFNKFNFLKIITKYKK